MVDWVEMLLQVANLDQLVFLLQISQYMVQHVMVLVVEMVQQAPNPTRELVDMVEVQQLIKMHQVLLVEIQIYHFHWEEMVELVHPEMVGQLVVTMALVALVDIIMQGQMVHQVQ